MSYKIDQSEKVSALLNQEMTSKVATVKSYAYAQAEKQLEAVMGRAKERATKPEPQTSITSQVIPLHKEVSPSKPRAWYKKDRLEGESLLAWENRLSEQRQLKAQYKRQAYAERRNAIVNAAIDKLSAKLGDMMYISPAVASTDQERKLLAVSEAVGQIDGSKRSARVTDKGLQSEGMHSDAFSVVLIGDDGKPLIDGKGNALRVTVQRQSAMTRTQLDIVSQLTERFRPFSPKIGVQASPVWKGNRLLSAVKVEEYYAIPQAERSKSIPIVRMVDATKVVQGCHNLPYNPLSGNGGTQSERKSSRRVGSVVVQPSAKPVDRYHAISDCLIWQYSAQRVTDPRTSFSDACPYGKHVHGGSMPVPASYKKVRTAVPVTIAPMHPPILRNGSAPFCAYPKVSAVSLRNVSATATATATATA